MVRVSESQYFHFTRAFPPPKIVWCTNPLLEDYCVPSLHCRELVCFQNSFNTLQEENQDGKHQKKQVAKNDIDFPPTDIRKLKSNPKLLSCPTSSWEGAVDVLTKASRSRNDISNIWHMSRQPCSPLATSEISCVPICYALGPKTASKSALFVQHHDETVHFYVHSACQDVSRNQGCPPLATESNKAATNLRANQALGFRGYPRHRKSNYT